MAELATLRKPGRVFTGTFTGITSDQALAIFPDSTGAAVAFMDIDDLDWDRIVVDLDITSYSGTSVTFKLKTCNNKSGTAIAATTMDLVDGAGSNVTSGSKTAVGRSLFKASRLHPGTTHGMSNAGKFLVLYADVTSIALLAGRVTIRVGK